MALDNEPRLGIETAAGGNRIRLAGEWSLATLGAAEAQLDKLRSVAGTRIDCDWSQAGKVDFSGAWIILTRLGAAASGLSVRHSGNPPSHVEFLDKLSGSAAPPQSAAHSGLPIAAQAVTRRVESLGRWAVARREDARAGLDFTGRIFAVLGGASRHITALRPMSLARHVYETGIAAIPIVSLIAFLIAVIVAYLGAQQLRKFGADIFVVDLVTIAVLREMGVLLTAIIIAGRSGSAFAAEIGLMQINEEVDALRAMGMNPIELLVVPRVLGLVIALPLLTVVADAMGLAGGGILSYLLLKIPLAQFTSRMQEAIAPTTFWVGLIKAPVFAFLIAFIGTLRGMQVRASARELGRLTTVAVVQAIFLVILADALFAVLFVELDI